LNTFLNTFLNTLEVFILLFLGKNGSQSKAAKREHRVLMFQTWLSVRRTHGTTSARQLSLVPSRLTAEFGSVAWETIEWNGHSSAINLEIYKKYSKSPRHKNMVEHI